MNEKTQYQKAPVETLRTCYTQGVKDALDLIKALDAEGYTVVQATCDPDGNYRTLRIYYRHRRPDLPCEERVSTYTLTCYGAQTDVLSYACIRMVAPVLAQAAVQDALLAFLAKHGCTLNLLPQRVANVDDLPLAGWQSSQLPGTNSDDTPQGKISLFNVAHSYCPRTGAVNFTLDTPLWQVREQLRTLHGEYPPLPADVAALIPEAILTTQFPHLATKPGNQGMIAFTQSEAAGIADRQQVMKAGRYIRQANAALSDEQVKQATAALVGSLEADIFRSNKAEDYERVYCNGPSSCMSYGPEGKEFRRLMVNGTFFHPTRVYAHPDNQLEIVWLEVNGRIGARTLINNRTMQYPRIYVSDSVANALQRLERWLEANGFEQSDFALDDQPLLLVHPDDFPDAIICPYIDCGNRGVRIDDDGKRLIVAGDYEANHSTGCLEDYDTEDCEPDWICDCCGNGCSDDDDRYCTVDDQDICSACHHREHRSAYHLGWAHMTVVHEGDNDLYSTEYMRDTRPFEYANYVYLDSFCDSLGDYDLVKLDEEYYDSQCVAFLDDCVRTENGYYVLTDDLDSHGLFYHDDEGEARDIDDYAILIDEDDHWELVEAREIDDDLHEAADRNPTSQYTMLPAFRVIAKTAIAETEEEAA